MQRKTEIELVSKVAKDDSPVRCVACGQSISEANWYLRVIKHTQSEPDKSFNVHDNEGVCLEILMVRLGLAKPTWKSSIASTTDESTEY